MNARQVFYGETGALRAPWRVLIFFFVTLATLFVSAAFAGPLITRLFALIGARGVTTESWIEVIGLLSSTAVCLQLIDKRPWRDVWLGNDAARPSLFGFGLLAGGLAIGVPIALLIGVHWLRLDVSGAGSWAGAAARITLFLLPAALVEELLTRGYILSVLRESWGWPWAIITTSVGFGLLHLGNKGVTAESVVLVTLAGFFLAGVLYATRSLYAAWMAHFAWNWTMAVIFHTAVSGYPLESPRYRYVDAGPDWATGGAWGPEGGIPAGFGMGIGIVYLFARRGRTTRRQET